MSKILLGDKTCIAIECEITSREGNFVFGKICMWANGERIGDYEKTDLVSRVAGLFNQSIRSRAKRKNSDLCQQTNKSIIEGLWNSIYGDLDDGIPLSEGIKYAPHELLVDWSDNFDDYVAAIIECDHNQRFIWKNRKTGSIGGIVLQKGSYEQLAGEFVNWMEETTGLKFID
jgi:hypothetical protein